MPPKVTRDLRKKQKSAAATTSRQPKIEKCNTDPPVETSVGPSRPSPREKPSPANSQSDAVFKIPIPIVDFRIETSPKRSTAETSVAVAEKSAAASKQARERHNTVSSTMIAIEKTDGDTTKPVSSTTPSRNKPPSTGSRAFQPSRRSQTSASESNCDNVSTADGVADLNSIRNGRIKRTEAERKQYFMNEIECGSIEAHRALCIRCKKWVRLSPRQTYYVKLWEKHRENCDQEVPAQHTYLDLGLVASLPFVVPKTEEVRKALLEIDDAIEIIEPEQIKCKTCEQWVPLEKRYNLECWSIHKAACRNNLNPLEIEKTLERKLFLLCDPQFKSFHNSQTVECAVCNHKIALDSGVDYDLEKWLAHKKGCHLTLKSPHASMGPSGSALSNVQQGSHSQTKATPISVPTSIESASNTLDLQSHAVLPWSDSRQGDEHMQTLSTTDSEGTLVPASSSTPALPSSSPLSGALATSSSLPQSTAPGSTLLKRKRDSLAPNDEDEPGSVAPYSNDTDMDWERPTNRPRTRDHILEEDTPRGLGLFLLPFKAFVKGFKESLTTL